MSKYLSVIEEYPRQFWLLFWGMLLSTIGASMIWPFLTIYASERLELPLTQTASLVTINSASSLIMTFVAGQITDRAGRKKVMVISLITNAILYFFLSSANTYVQFATLMALLGASNPLYRVGANAMLADLIPPEKRADGYAIIRLSDNAGVAIGPSIGGFIAAASQFFAFYIAASGLFLYGLVLLFFAVETLPQYTKDIQISVFDQGSYKSVFKDISFISFVANSTLGLLANSLMWVLLPVYATQVLNIPKQMYGFLPTTNAFMIVLFQVMITRWTKRYRPLRMTALGMLFYAIGVGSVALGSNFWGLWISMIIITIGEMIIVPTGSAYVANISPEHMRGRYMGIYSLTWSLSIGIGPLLGGILSDNYGPSATWIGGLVIGLTSMSLFFVIERIFTNRESQTT